MDRISMNLTYDLFLAESEMFDKLITAGCGLSIHESYIIEGLQETINNYIQRVTESIQKSWNKFNSSLLTKKDIQFLKSISSSIKNTDITFTINNFPSYDKNIFTSYKVIPFDYLKMKDILKEKTTFIKKTYPELGNNQTAKNLYEALEQSVIKGYSNTQVNKQFLVNIYNYCSSNFRDDIKSIEDDLTIINSSNNIIINNAQQIADGNIQQEAMIVYESMILEAPTITNNKDEKKSISFTDSDGEKTDPNDKSQQKNKDSYTKAVTNYMKASTDLMASKMKLISTKYRHYMFILEHYMELEEKKKKHPPVTDKKEKLPTQVKIK